MVLAHLPASRRAGTKPLIHRRPGHRDRRLGAARAGPRYSELQAGVQLANRSGALNEIEYSEFVQKVQAFAEAWARCPTSPTCWTWWPGRASSTALPARWTRS
jgi:hypothetical protein